MAEEASAQDKKLSSQSAASSSSSTMSLMLGLLEPLQEHMLDYLPIKVMAALRQACSATRLLVDDSTFPHWEVIAKDLHVPDQLRLASMGLPCKLCSETRPPC